MSQSRFPAKFLILPAMLSAALLAGGCKSEGAKSESAFGKKPTSGLTTGGAGAGQTGAGRELGGAELTQQHVVYFDFDKSDLKPEAEPVLNNWARFLSQNPSARVRLEGHTDERGTREYNMALGERRSRSVQQALQLRGVSAGQLTVISYGEERPVALCHDESCWSQNRRVELVQQ